MLVGHGEIIFEQKFAMRHGCGSDMLAQLHTILAPCQLWAATLSIGADVSLVAGSVCQEVLEIRNLEAHKFATHRKACFCSPRFGEGVL